MAADERTSTPRERIVIRTARRGQAGEPALVAFLTAGFPSREKFREHLSAVAAGADVVEIGVPFTDPMADGVTIQRASEQALRARRDARAGYWTSSRHGAAARRRCC